MKNNDIVYNFQIILLYLLQKLKYMLHICKDKIIHKNSEIYPLSIEDDIVMNTNINTYKDYFTTEDYGYDADCEDNYDM